MFGVLEKAWSSKRYVLFIKIEMITADYVLKTLWIIGIKKRIL